MPRYRFTKGGLFGWVEVEDTVVRAVQGRREDEATLVPSTEQFATAALATKQGNALIAKFRARGYEPDEIGDLAALKRAREHKAELADVAALEELVAEDPTNADAWSVLEDKLLEAEDPRGQLLLLAREGIGHDEAVRNEFLPQLFGTQHLAYKRALRREEWRGGYLIDCTIEPEPIQMLDSFLQLPATRLLATLRLGGLNSPSIYQCAQRLAIVKSRPRSLRDVRFDCSGAGRRAPLVVDLAKLAPMRLRSLASNTPQLPLRNLVVHPDLEALEASEDTLDGVSALFSGTLPKLSTVKLATIDDERWELAGLERIARSLTVFAPELRSLVLQTHRRAMVDAFGEAIAKSPLAGKVQIGLRGAAVSL